MDFCPIIKRRITTYEERGLSWPASVNDHLNVCTWCKAWADAKKWLGGGGSVSQTEPMSAARSFGQFWYDAGELWMWNGSSWTQIN